tara:strand:- start:490 stop:1683 length:1194 start_codon:yes stop_codon:yes gene_type:complete
MVKVFQVGGSVRDEILGSAPKDRDYVVVNGSEKELIKAGYKRVGKNFPVFLHPTTKEEYALARTEKKEGLGHRGFSTDTSKGITLEEDLARRDFTINAIAKDSTGKIFDPFGGLQDIERKTLRHITDAFREDPLRVLRGARFSATLGFKIAEETQILMLDMVKSGELKSLPVERIERELRLAIAGHRPHYFFETLKKCKAIPQLLPELDLPQLYNSDDPIFQALKHFEGQGRMAEERFIVFLSRAGNYGLQKNGKKTQIETLIKRLKLNRRTAETYTMYRDFNQKIMNYASLGEQDVLRLFEEMDTFRRPEKLTRLLKILRYIIEPAISSNHVKKLTSFFMEALSETSKLSARTFFTNEEIARTDYSTISQTLRVEREKKIRETIIKNRIGLKSVDE